MDIELIEQFPTSIKFVLKNSTLAFANTIRRIILTEVPTLVIEDVYVLKNTSPLFDEFIAHRLGLIPLKYNPELLQLNFRDECDCGGIGCNLCTVTLTLSKKTDDQRNVVVYSGDLVSTEEGVEPVDKNIPIVKLGKNQEIELECMAQLGRGKEHAKWQPVSAMGYQEYPVPKINEEQCSNCGNCVDICYRNVFEMIDNKCKVVNPTNCNLCRFCVDKCPENAISIEKDPTSIIFSFETNGVDSPINILTAASEILISKIDEFKKHLEKSVHSSEEM
ncbi:MAG: DNA-directed RNA polymerase subunit D [Candidatus Heimdallarchaeaceae archaeon]